MSAKSCIKVMNIRGPFFFSNVCTIHVVLFIFKLFFIYIFILLLTLYTHLFVFVACIASAETLDFVLKKGVEV